MPEIGLPRRAAYASYGGQHQGGESVVVHELSTITLLRRHRLRMILIYRKGTKDDLTPKEKAVLRKLNEDWER